MDAQYYCADVPSARTIERATLSRRCLRSRRLQIAARRSSPSSHELRNTKHGGSGRIILVHKEREQGKFGMLRGDFIGSSCLGITSIAVSVGGERLLLAVPARAAAGGLIRAA